MKLKTLTLGCKVNQYETQYLRDGLATLGYTDAADGESADLCVVNTCTVTAEGDAKSRQVIRRMARENPAAKIVVMGCYATRAPEEVALLPGVTEVLTDKRQLPDLLGRFGVTDTPSGISGFGGRSRAYVKVQDGCMLRCSFCIIPSVRPNLASRPAEEVVQEVARLISLGHREIVLTGIHLGHYGVEWNRHLPKDQWRRLSHLVRMLADLPNAPGGEPWRVRLSSIEATEVTRELIEVMADCPDRVAPHLHISMQSGSDSVLRRMHRRWGVQRFVDRCALLQERLDRPAITTDVIVGFPGETDAEFQETIETCRQVGFSKIHIFPFSARRGTPAAEFPGQLSKPEKQQRVEALAGVERELRDRYFATLVGSRLRVLLETPVAGGAVGTSCRYATVKVPGAPTIGRMVDVVAGPATEGIVLGEQTSDS